MKPSGSAAPIPCYRLAGWPILDRLTALNLCAPLSPDPESLIAEFLEPRVFVGTSY